MAEIQFTYTNWRGETSTRRAVPLRLRFGTSDWHKEPQPLMLAVDMEKNEQREFAVRDMQDVSPDAAFDLMEHHPIAWDAHSNRSYAPVESRAEVIYSVLAVDHKDNRRPWVPGGNSTKQDEARAIARVELREAGHVPA